MVSVNKVWYEFFLLDCFDLHKVWKCFTLLEWQQVHPQPSVSEQNINGKASEVFNWMYRSLRAGELSKSFPMALKTSSFQPLAFMPVWKAPCTTCNLHGPTSIIWENSFSVPLNFKFSNFPIGVWSVRGKHDHWFLG